MPSKLLDAAFCCHAMHLEGSKFRRMDQVEQIALLAWGEELR